MKKLIFILVFIFVIIASWELFRSYIWNDTASEIKTSHHLILKEMKVLGKLELSSFLFKDIVEQELDRPFLPNPKAVLIVEGEAVACIDLTKITDKSLRTIGDTLEILMPNPELCSYKINHEKSRIYDTQFAFMNEQPLMNEAYLRAESKIKESAIESGILNIAKTNAQTILKPLLEKVSDKKVVLIFQN